MRSYRLYCLDEWNRIGLSEDVEAKTDEEAVALARETNPAARKCELWEGRRLVATSKGQSWQIESVMENQKGRTPVKGRSSPII